MSKVSAVIITFNEEKYIEECIRSVEVIADEIVVVDSFSTDRTPEICRSLGVRYVEHHFNGYRDQKNFALTQASYDYVLSLDADEVLSPKLERSILAIKKDFRYDGYKFVRLNRYSSRLNYRSTLFPERKLRLFNKAKAHWGGYNIHEIVILDNPQSVKRLKGNLLHSQFSSYEERIEKMNRYSTLLANEYFKQGIKASVKKVLFNPIWRFFHSFFIRGEFTYGYDGFVMSKLLAATCFLKYVKLRNLEIQAKQTRSVKYHRVDSIYKIDGRAKHSSISIGFDAKRAFYNYSGLGNYSRNFLSALTKIRPDNSYYLFTPKTKDRFIMENEGQYNLIEPNLAVFKLINPLWRSKYMIDDIKRQKLELFHGLSQELPLGIEKTGVKSIVTVHDLIFMRFPEFYNWIDSKIYYGKLIHACRVSVRYLSISPDKISVIYQGCNPYFWNTYSKESFQEVRKKYCLPERYLLYVGTIEERKNLLGIVKAIQVTNINIPLVVVGRKVDPYFKNILSYIAAHKLKNIVFAESISNIDLPIIYQNAECFIYPSFFEGFGLPILEALVSRTPVITSKGGCFVEAAGPGSYFVDPDNPEMIGKAVLEIVNNKEIRDKMISIGKQYADNFRDDVIVNNYMKLYYSLLK
jgi:glycosyltransferase involved in cell wall biosynthesis